MKMIKLDFWAVIQQPWDGYTAPELIPSRLQGVVEGHPAHKDGTTVTTSAIKKVEGRTVTTSSGSVYILGEPDPRYIAFLVENGKPIPNDENPLGIK